MKIVISLILFFGLNYSYALCEFTQSRRECELLVHIEPQPYAHSVAYCGQSLGYLTPMQYDILTRYQRAHTNLTLEINGEYIDSPCIGGKR